MDVAGHSVNLLALVSLGVLVGLIAGMFGVGGGFVVTPLLSVVLGVPLPIAVGSGMCQMIGTSMAALLRHQKLGQGDTRFGWLMLGGSILGAVAGARTVEALEGYGSFAVTVTLDVAYVAFLLFALIPLLRRERGGIERLAYVRHGPLTRVPLPPFVDLPRVPLTHVSVPLVAYIGLGLGFVSGLLGVGGGIALMPILLYGFGFSMRQAAGTGTFVMLATAVSGTVAHAFAGNVHLGLALVLLVGASISAQVGALGTKKLPAGLLRRGLALMIVGTLAAVVFQLLKTLS
jgi:uncharacterized membrane protein YfcA